jgi:class 3 adenylate cyclase
MTDKAAGLGYRAGLGNDPEQRPFVAIGIGINTGSLMLGTIGERHRMDGTVISDAVNLAVRVESLTKYYKVPLMISEYTWRQLADPKAYDIRPIDVVVKGKTRPVAIFEVYQRDPPTESAVKGLEAQIKAQGVD